MRAGHVKSQESAAFRFLYQTVPGRCCLKVLTRPWISVAAGAFLDSKMSAFLVPGFVRKNQIDMSDFEQRDYYSFNDFFTRFLTEGSRPMDMEPNSLISPCDGLLSVYKITDWCRVMVKHSMYRMEDLLRDRKLAASYRDGYCLVFRLRPRDYHHYCHIDQGIVKCQRRIPGILHSVRPAALDAYPVFVQNTREYAVIDTEHFGQIVQMEVGALLVGRIRNRRWQRLVRRGTEKGYFEFGGSTIILFLKKNKACLDADILKCSERGEEVEIRVGEHIGERI